MIFMCIVSLILILLAVLIDQDISNLFGFQKEAFEKEIYSETNALFANIDDQTKLGYCEQDKNISQNIYQNVVIMRDLSIFCSISYIASIISSLLTSLTK